MRDTEIVSWEFLKHRYEQEHAMGRNAMTPKLLRINESTGYFKGRSVRSGTGMFGSGHLKRIGFVEFRSGLLESKAQPLKNIRKEIGLLRRLSKSRIGVM